MDKMKGYKFNEKGEIEINYSVGGDDDGIPS